MARLISLMNGCQTMQVLEQVPTGNVASNQNVSNRTSNIKLPRLNLPVFTGKYSEWTPFAQMFQTMISENNKLSNVEKLQYLRSSLSGDASDSVESLELTGENFMVAWRILSERYDRIRVIVQSHIQAVMDIPCIRKESHSELKSLINITIKHVNALKSLKRPVDKWDDILIQILGNKLDSKTFRDWEDTLQSDQIPTTDQFIEFVLKKCNTLESVSSKENISTNGKANQGNSRRSAISCAASAFLTLSVVRRLEEIKKRKLCINCLKSKNHIAAQCTSGTCRTCQLKHNTLLHIDKQGSSKSITTDGSPSNQPGASETVNSQTVVTHHMSNCDNKYVMLSTALVDALDAAGKRVSCRVLLDNGSQANLVTREFLSKLSVTTKQHQVSIVGINQLVSSANEIATIIIQSRTNSFRLSIDCIVTERITGSIPMVHINKRAINLPKNIRLADPQFNVPSEVQLLLGVDVFWQLLCIGQIKSSLNNPTLQKTHLGWILAGSINNTYLKNISNNELEHSLTKFWEFEHNLSNQVTLSPSERECEEHFLTTIARDDEGRFIVTLPIKSAQLQQLGESRSIALRRLYNLEKRFKHNVQLQTDYTNFLQEYLKLGHMHLADDSSVNDDTTRFYLPHYCVFKQTSTTTKLRVVFDGSCKSSTGTSLNDILMVGPVVQSDLFSLLVRFRTYEYVFTADVVKMYRQILVNQSQLSLQSILWRDHPTESVRTYELKTITYGTASAPYLATRCLKYLAEIYHNKFPVGAQAIINDVYVDDVLTGARSLSEAICKRNQIITIMSKSGFELNKWFSNDIRLLEGLRSTGGQENVRLTESSTIRILGMQWNPHEDSFCYTVNVGDMHSNVTKRNMLAEASCLFDPLGFIGPVILISKLMIQELWRLQLDWDASVPVNIHSRWLDYKTQISKLVELRIPRMIGPTMETLEVQFHGFADASQHAYGACCYLRIRNSHNDCHTHLLASKSRVAPAKAISLPRLELCAALLLAQLQVSLLKAIEFQPHQIYLWTDSTITLSWIKSSSYKFATFVSNRIGEIQRLTKIKDWHHISTKHNPADIISRGASSLDLMQSKLWWNGPEWLSSDEKDWPDNHPQYPETLPDQVKVNVHVVKQTLDVFENLIVRYPSFGKLIRVLAYVFQFIHNCRNPLEKHTGVATVQDRECALQALCRYVQHQYFDSEIQELIRVGVISKTSKILSLNPFLDRNGLLRVGGRLRNSDISYEAKHPILLPKDHMITKLIIRDEHIKNLHAGIQLTLYAVRSKFWPISAKVTTRDVIKNCIICFKLKPTISQSVMSDLPSTRVTPSHPFTHTGLDFGGPFIIREHKRRNARKLKAYICIFVCFSTKAMHIELVADLTSEAFLASLKRFMARRGKVACLYSDNGTNFVGAARELNELHRMFTEEQVQRKLNDFFSETRIQWQNIPPNAPHFGGLWEAAIKSAKYHMKRIIGNASLNYDEMSTVITEIEAILNSRPISPMSNDLNDVQALSPGHFLIGQPLNSYSHPNLEDIQINRLSRWQLVERLRQHFWQRWQIEYLNSLQGRSKWMNDKGQSLETGQLVIIQQSGLAPMQWLMGRVLSVNRSSDNKGRSAQIKTSNGVVTRPLARLAILPVDTKA
ncbi:PREDICTED: uncharacterized protein LOC108759145 [Trachymyrmex cornetzi]|uniref:uncharacterized protein LOC108759145 n=1 Tax=Trachymyrmex cornetzi TaxID=471704 RepID=UPI00084F3729|nr:PREDICTED: uncharacterized protein LOC108759145 [Trachymyrmex cornetzi]